MNTSHLTWHKRPRRNCLKDLEKGGILPGSTILSRSASFFKNRHPEGFTRSPWSLPLFDSLDTMSIRGERVPAPACGSLAFSMEIGEYLSKPHEIFFQRCTRRGVVSDHCRVIDRDDAHLSSRLHFTDQKAPSPDFPERRERNAIP